MKTQHVMPCSDCPWRRRAVRGWLGLLGGTEEWLARAHGETWVECHCRADFQCAGMAIFRANVGKLPRYREILRLGPDTAHVFASDAEFTTHHLIRHK